MVATPGGAGTEVWVVDPSLFTLPYDHELCQAVCDAGYRVRLVGRRLRPNEATVSAPRYRFDPLFYPGTEGGRWRVLPGPIRSWVKGVEHWRGMRRLAEQVRTVKPDVVHFQWLPVPFVDGHLIGAFPGSCSMVLTVHDATAVSGRDFGAVQRFGWTRALRLFNRYVVHDEAGRRALAAHGVDPKKVAVLPHPPLPLPQGDPIADSDDAVLMLFGEVKPYKGADVAIEALAILPEALRARVRLVVAGRPRMALGPLKDLARNRGVEDRVEWIDRYIPLEELRAVLSSAAIFLLPYREADASGVLSQVLQLGRPIVASRTGNFPEVVTGAGCGVVVDPGDAAGLAAAVAGVLENPEAAGEMGQQARRLWLTMPSWAAVAAQLTSLYFDHPADSG